jgi:hypothetical protein
MPRKKKSVSPSISGEQAALLKNLTSAILTRKKFAESLGYQFNGQRSLYDVLGYKISLVFQDYYAAYDRGDIAQRIVDAPPNATWRRKPIISNGGDPKQFTKFETDWAKLVQLRKVFHYMERADRLAGIGEYGALLIGTDDVRQQDDMQLPMAKLRHGINSVLYLAPLSQEFCEVQTADPNPASPRYGLPEFYSVMIAENNSIASEQNIARNSKIPVHWSRIIHVAENLKENDIYGTPRLRHVMNRLYDLDKIAGGAAEIFWQAAKRIMVLQAKDNFAAVDSDDALTDMMDELIHGLRRVVDVQGYDVKTLESSDVKPDEAFRVTVALISSATGIPQRILLGSEEGKMASEQDEVNWNGKITDRQTNFAEPVILRPFIDRLILAGALSNPGNEYIVSWPSLFELSDKEKATVGLIRAKAIAAYVGMGGVNAAFSEIISPVEEFRREVLGLRSEAAETLDGSLEGDGAVSAFPAAVNPAATSDAGTPPSIIDPENAATVKPVGKADQPNA